MTLEAPGVVAKKKLIEVALPLDAINAASKREKSIRHGHPSTLHLWWARRPLAAARAVIFAQMVDDPSANPDLFPTGRAQERERQRLFRIIEDLVKWENTTNEAVLERARDEIWQSWRRACAENADHPRAKELFNRRLLPAFHDPFAGGGSLPLEAQRLGLEAHASDLNPVAVLINKAMIEIPPKFAGRPPVNPEARGDRRLLQRTWRGAEGLAEDVRYYGRWMRNEAEKRIGHLYPKVRVTAEMAQDRPDLAPYVDRDLTVIAWLWARTVNPAFADVDVPLASTFILSKKDKKKAYVEPTIEDGGYRFTVKTGSPGDPASTNAGTKVGRASFVCLVSGSPIPTAYIKAEGQAGRIGARLMAIVAEGDRGRVYLAPTSEHEGLPLRTKPTEWRPEGDVPARLTGGTCVPYGLDEWWKLFTPRQLVALTTFSDLVSAAIERAQQDAVAAGISDDGAPLRDGGTGATGYSEAVGVYLAFVLSKQADLGNSLCRWEPNAQCPRQLFGRQAIPMVWDYAEGNPLGESSGAWNVLLGGLVRAFSRAFAATADSSPGYAEQADVAAQDLSEEKVISTDPPYFDNIGYADLSDFFYLWFRRHLRSMFPEFFTTLAVPKSEELVANPYRHGSNENAEVFFLSGMTRAMQRFADQGHPAFPVTIYYAFKQSERTSVAGGASTGWETFLEAVVVAGFSVSGTWPMRTENATRLVGMGTNALSSSIVMACRPRAADARIATRREFQAALRSEFPAALAHLQRSNIAPVDLAQASIGPGMAVFTRYRQVLNADSTAMSVRDALALINATLDEVLAEQEGDFDADSRWALAWFEQLGFTEGDYGLAETLSKAKNTSVDGLVRAGIVESRRGTVRLFQPDELDPDWNPAADRRLTVWEMTHHLIRALESGGEPDAAVLAATLGSQAETARDLAYRLYTVSERRKRAADALQYNGLVQSWPEIVRIAGDQRAMTATQGALAIDGA